MPNEEVRRDAVAVVGPGLIERAAGVQQFREGWTLSEGHVDPAGTRVIQRGEPALVVVECIVKESSLGTMPPLLGMFKNLINRQDALGALRKAREGRLWQSVAPATRSGRARVESAWAHIESTPTHWWDVPTVMERRRLQATGDPHTHHVDYLTATYLRGRTGLRGFSVGCGTGHRELRWARTGVFSRLEACDVSAPRVDHANASAEAAGLRDVFCARTADVFDLDLEPESLDVVIGEDSIHHLTPLSEFFRRVEGWLKPDGYLFLSEFVGPTRFQWTDRQLEAANGLLRVLPERLRMSQRHGGGPKREVERPSLSRMYLTDPSESVESARIVPVVRERFDVVEDRALGGTLVALVLADIAHHFREPDAVAAAFLGASLDLEEEMIRAGDIGSDYRLLVCQRRSS